MSDVPNPKPAPQSAKIAGYLLLAVILIGVGALFAVTMSSRLNPSQAQQSSADPGSGQTAGTEDMSSLEGRMAPGFELHNLKGQTVKLADYHGKIVFLNFWATWCDPCKKEMPSMERLYQKMKGQPFEILAVSLDKNPVQEVPAFAARTRINLSFPVLAETADQKVSKLLYKTTGVPESFIIDHSGKVIKHAIGAYEWDNPQIMQYLESLLKAARTAEASQPQTKG